MFSGSSATNYGVLTEDRTVDKHQMASSYKAQLDAQKSFRSNMPVGNMTQAEKSMNKLDLHAFKYNLNVDGSIVPGVA